MIQKINMPTGVYVRTNFHIEMIKIGISKHERHLSDKGREILSQKCIERHLGKKQSEETKIKRGIYKTGINHHKFKHGLSENKEYKKILKREWVNLHRDYVNYTNAIRRALLKNSKGSFSYEDWIYIKRKFNYTCQMCGKKEPEIKLTIDHIIPLSKGGDNDIKNIQPLCKFCNCSKGNKIILQIKSKLEDLT